MERIYPHYNDLFFSSFAFLKTSKYSTNSTVFYNKDKGILKYTGIVIFVTSFPINFLKNSHTGIEAFGSLKVGIYFLIMLFYFTGYFS